MVIPRFAVDRDVLVEVFISWSETTTWTVHVECAENLPVDKWTGAAYARDWRVREHRTAQTREGKARH